jgi:hypothetical protein
MKSARIIAFVLIAGLLSSCATKVYFTEDIRNRIESAGISLKQIQYYNNIQVTLKRELTSGKTKVESGKVKLEDGRYIHYIFLNPLTPGVCKNINDNKLSIAFEEGNNKTLNFGKPKDGNGSSPYQIYAIEWNDNVGKINYEGETYYIQPRGSNAKLMIKKSVLNKLDIEKRRMKGVRLN